MRSCISQFWQGGVLSPEYCGIKGRLGQPVRMRRVGVGREETEESRDWNNGGELVSRESENKEGL